MTSVWKLYLDDKLEPLDDGWTVAKTSAMAIVICVKRKALPVLMSLDHELSEGDNIFLFLKELKYLWELWGSDPNKIPKFHIHSPNLEMAKKIFSFMETWKKEARDKK